MELAIVAVFVVLAGAFWYWNRDTKTLDINQDGKIDSADVAKQLALNEAVTAVEKERDEFKNSLVTAQAAAQQAATAAGQSNANTTSNITAFAAAMQVSTIRRGVSAVARSR